MPDTEWTVSQPIVTVAPRGLGFNGVVDGIRRGAAHACRAVLGRLSRALERQAQARAPERRVNVSREI